MNDPAKHIQMEMRRQGLRPVDLKPAFGTSSRFYSIMNKRRKLTLPMIRALAFNFGMNAERLLKDYELAE